MWSRRSAKRAARREWIPPVDHEADRNGEPVEALVDDAGNLLLYVIVLAALCVILGAELLALWLLINPPWQCLIYGRF